VPIYHEGELRVWDQENKQFVSKPVEIKTKVGLTPTETLERLTRGAEKIEMEGIDHVRPIDTDR
jgi:hypothetical protein